MILCVDIGNTRAKIALLRDNEVLASHAYPHTALLEALSAYWAALLPPSDCPIPAPTAFTLPAEVQRVVATLPPPLRGVALCSVSTEIAGLDQLLSKLPIPHRWLRPDQPPRGISIAYRTPHTLGADRLAAVLGARTLCPTDNLLVVDIGTCITFDVLTRDGRFEGGNISPGIELRLCAMHEHTARLPLVSPQGETPPLGYDTPTALRSGVMQGIGYEIEGYIRHLGKQYAPISIFLTGGAAKNFAISAENCIFADEHLVARGLATLFEP